MAILPRLANLPSIMQLRGERDEIVKELNKIREKGGARSIEKERKLAKRLQEIDDRGSKDVK